MLFRPSLVNARNAKNVAVPKVVFEKLYAFSRSDGLKVLLFEAFLEWVALIQAAGNTSKSSSRMVLGGLRGPPKRYSINGIKGFCNEVY